MVHFLEISDSSFSIKILSMKSDNFLQNKGFFKNYNP